MKKSFIRIMSAGMVVAMTASTLNGVGLDTVYAESVAIATYADSGNTSTLAAPKVPKEDITADTATSFTASWTAVEGAAKYEVKVGLQDDVTDPEAEIKSPNDPKNNTITSLTITSFGGTNLKGGTTYYYWVRAIDSSGNASDWSETVKVRPRQFTITVSETVGYQVVFKTMNPLPFREDCIFEILAESNNYSLENLKATITGGLSLKPTRSINDGENCRGYEFVIPEVVGDTYVIIEGVDDLKPLKKEATGKIEEAVEECGTVINGLKSLSDEDKQKLADNVTAAEGKAKQAVHDAVTEGTVKAAGETPVKDIRKVVADIVPEAIENIGTVSYDQECKNKIDDAKALFDFLTEEEKAQVDKDTVAKLENALKEYDALETAAKLQEARDAAKQEVDSAAADVEKRIDALEKAPDARKAEWKESLSGKADTGKTAIDKAETKDEVNAKKDEAIADINNIFTDIAKALIDEIGEVKDDDSAKDKIDAAKEAFDKLTEEEKEKIPDEDKKKLADAEEQYNALVAAKELQKAKQEAKKAVENAVDEAGKGIDSFTKVPDAKKKAWKDEVAAKAEAGKVEIDAENTVAGVETARDNTVSSIRDIIINIAKDLINEIGEVKKDDSSKDKIDAAKEAFDKLTDEEKEKIPEEDKNKLTEAEEEYSALVAAKELQKAKQEAKKAVENAVEEAGKGIDSLEKVSDSQKKAWKNEAAAKAETGNMKIDAENTVAGVETARDNAVSSIRDILINIAKDLINEIGEVKKDDSSKDKIDAAKEAFEKLTEEEKEKIPDEDKKKLTEAEKQYSDLVAAEELRNAKQEAKQAVENAVEEVSEGIDSFTKVPDAQKKAWKNEVAAKAETGNVKIDAEDTVKGVESAKDNAVSSIRNILINIAKDLINEIGEVKKDDSSKDKIDAAKEAFEKLTEEEKEKIPEDDKKKLTEAEKQYNALEAAEELKKPKEDAGKDVRDAVDTVNKRIDALKNASDEQKKAWKDEVAAKETAGNKEIDAADSAKWVETAKDNAVSAIHNIYIDIVKKLINNIGEVKNDDASKKKIETAKEAFDSLTDTEKQKIPADLTKKLQEAQTQYAAFAQVKEQPGEANTNTIPEKEAEKQIVNVNTDKNDPSNSQFSRLRLKATGAKKSIKLSWTKVNGADGYIIYGSRCGKKMKRIKTVGANKKTYTVKKLEKGKYYKYIVSAYKLVDGKKSVISTSKSAHAVTLGGKYGNPTKVIYSKSTINLKKGRTKTLKPKMKTSKKIRLHIAKFRYESTNPSVVTVDKKGKLNAKQKGTSYVYIYAQNGYYKKIKVNVK